MGNPNKEPRMIADTPEKIAFLRLITLRSAVSLEAKGMKMSRGKSALSIAKGMGFKARTAQKMVKVLDARIELERRKEA
jgi:hypothetical protein